VVLAVGVTQDAIETAERAKPDRPQGGAAESAPQLFGRIQNVAISREDVLHVAALAQLELSEEEIARLTVELNDILAAVGKVSELDLSDVPPTSHPLAVVNVFRPDEPRPSLPLDDAFANAPERDGDYFRVPPTGAAEDSSA
jgi:aspartyl-tRNA(Asn)/glutamyl-tRNA(Gln) amidotransferase subunit C